MKVSVCGPRAQELHGALAAHGIEHRLRIDEDVDALVSPAVVGRHVRGENALSIFVPPAPPPLNRVTREGPTRSFVASGPWAARLPAMETDGVDDCFRALHLALSGEVEIPDIAIFNGVEAVERALGATQVEFIIPHMGSHAHLDVCMSGVLSQSIHCTASVCLDEVSSWRAARTDGRIRQFRALDPPVGPYAIRQFLGMKSTADFLAFQDSDDYSTSSRLSELLTACERTGADSAGCHELRLDEIDRVVIPVRFPMDVNAALSEIVAHPQLFPTTVTRSATFKRIGGLSTTRKFGADTEYLLRSYFSIRSINIDRFLYIRRRREGSLTTAPETALHSPIRIELGRIWREDFENIKLGRLDLENSSLALRHGAAVEIVATDRADD